MEYFSGQNPSLRIYPNLFRSYVTYTDLKLAANILYNKSALQFTLLSNNLSVLFKYVSLIMFNALCRHRNELLPRRKRQKSEAFGSSRARPWTADL